MMHAHPLMSAMLRAGIRVQRVGIVLVVALIVTNTYFFRVQSLGVLLLGMYIAMLSLLLFRCIHLWKKWPVWFGFVMSFLGGMFMLGSLAGLAVLVHTINAVALVYILLLPVLGAVVAESVWLSRSRGRHEIVRDDLHNSKAKHAQRPVIPLKYHSYLLAAIFSFLVLAAILLVTSRTGEFITSPWDALSPLYGAVMFVVALLLLVYIFSGASIRMILMSILAFSLVLHGYLFVVYQEGFGGDKWRHMGYELQIVDERPVEPTLLSPRGREHVTIGSVSVPAVFVDPKIPYSFMWGLLALLSKISLVDVFYIDLLFFPLVSALLLPLVLFMFAKRLFHDQRLQLLFAFAPNFFAVFQVNGSITIPLSVGFIFFVCALFFFDVHKRSIMYGGLVTLLLILFGFQYTVVALFLGLFVMLFLCQKITHSALRTISQFLLFISFIGVATGLDMMNDYSILLWDRIPDLGYFLESMNTWIRRTILGYDVSGIRMLLWMFAASGILYVWKMKNHPAYYLIRVFLWMLLSGLILQFFSEFYLDGLRLVTGRIDMFVAFSLLPFVVFGVGYVLQRFRSRKALVAVSFVLSAFFLVEYAGYPSLKTVTTDQVHAAEYLQTHHLSADKPSCVVADEWQLLALQKVTRSRVHGGGFPIGRDYIQSEKDDLFFSILRDPGTPKVQSAFRLTGAEECFFLFEERFAPSQGALHQLHQHLTFLRQYGDVSIFRFVQD